MKVSLIEVPSVLSLLEFIAFASNDMHFVMNIIVLFIRMVLIMITNGSENYNDRDC